MVSRPVRREARRATSPSGVYAVHSEMVVSLSVDNTSPVHVKIIIAYHPLIATRPSDSPDRFHFAAVCMCVGPRCALPKGVFATMSRQIFSTLVLWEVDIR